MKDHINITKWYEINHVAKTWGHEDWVANSPMYCGKRIVILPGQKTSYHYHKIKHEDIYVASGSMTLLLADDVWDEPMEYQLVVGDSIHIDRNMPHCLINTSSTTNLELFEFSTEHFNSDSYKINLNV